MDAATDASRQKRMFQCLERVLRAPLKFSGKDAARAFFQRLTQMALGWNRAEETTSEFGELEQQILREIQEAAPHA